MICSFLIRKSERWYCVTELNILEEVKMPKVRIKTELERCAEKSKNTILQTVSTMDF
jgi:hypothetical protein